MMQSQMYGSNVDDFLNDETIGLTREVLPAELEGELPHGDDLSKVLHSVSVPF